LAPISLYKDFLLNRKPIIAADSGGEYLQKMGITPDYLLGDFDSISEKTLSGMKKDGVSTRVFPEEKDETDLEITATFALKKGFNRIIILGAWGGRPDQSLAGIAVLNKIKREKAHGVILNPQNSLELISDFACLEKEKGRRFSLIPWGGKVSGLRIKGCKFNVKNAVLTPWGTLGISNEILEEKAEIFLEKGLAVLVRDLEPYFSLEDVSQ